MSDYRQLQIRWDGRTDCDAWTRIRDLCRQVVEHLGHKQVAYDLDISGSQLSHALAGRERNYVRAEWLVYLVARAPSDELLQALCELRQCDAVPRAPMDAEAKLAALEDALRASLGEDLLTAIYQRAMGRRGR